MTESNIQLAGCVSDHATEYRPSRMHKLVASSATSIVFQVWLCILVLLLATTIASFLVPTSLLLSLVSSLVSICSSRQKESTDDSPSAALAPWQESRPALAVDAADLATRAVRGHARGCFAPERLRLRACAKTLTHTASVVQGDFPVSIPSATFQAQAAQAVSAPANQVVHGSFDRHASGELLHNMTAWLCIQSCEVQEALPVKPQKFTQKALICCLN